MNESINESIYNNDSCNNPLSHRPTQLPDRQHVSRRRRGPRGRRRRQRRTGPGPGQRRHAAAQAAQAAGAALQLPADGWSL